MPSFFCMPFFACNRQVDSLDKRQCNLQTIPHEIERYSRTLEELLLDMNHIRELPKSLFRLQKLRRLGLSDNDIHRLPSEVATLQNLVELNISRNDISDLPEDLKNCRNLLFLDVSSNPIARLPDTITQVISLTQLSLNDTSLTKLPQDIGQLRALKSLEVRENHLRSLPASIVQLIHLLRLDLGQNELDILPTELGALRSLQELYADDNSIESLPESILQCTALEQLDVSSNRLLTLPSELGEMTSLVDLSLSHNCLSFLPNSIGRLKRLTILRLDDNSFLQLTPAIGSCSSLNELYLMQNLISELPSTIGNLHNLQNLNVDKNQLTSLPPLIGECASLSLLSLRDNQMEELPMEIGKLTRLRVFDVCNNRLSYLPFTINVLFNLQALWLSENQSQALLKLQQEVDSRTGMKVLTCYLLPQQSAAANEINNRPPNRSFVGGPKVHFGELDEGGGAPPEADDVGGSVTTSAGGFGNFERHDTPHPKPNAKAPAVGTGKPTKKTSIDGHIIPRLDDVSHHSNHQTTISLSKKSTAATEHATSNSASSAVQFPGARPNMPRPALKHSTAAFHAAQNQNVFQQNANNASANKSTTAAKEKSVAFSSSGRRCEAGAVKDDESHGECRLKRVNTPHYGRGYSLNHSHNVPTTSGGRGASAPVTSAQPSSSPSATANVTTFSATGRSSHQPQQQDHANISFPPSNSVTAFPSSSISTAFPAGPPHQPQKQQQNRFTAEEYYQRYGFSAPHPFPTSSNSQQRAPYDRQSSYHTSAAPDHLIDGMLEPDSTPAAAHQSARKNLPSDSTISLAKSSSLASCGPTAPAYVDDLSAQHMVDKRFVTKRVIVRREPNHGLGLSIAGGVESNPYIDGDCGLFISKLIPAAPAERAGLLVGDKILEINTTSMLNQRHDVAVECIQKSPEILNLVISRNVEHLPNVSPMNEQAQQSKEVVGPPPPPERNASVILPRVAVPTSAPSSLKNANVSSVAAEAVQSRILPALSNSFSTPPNPPALKISNGGGKALTVSDMRYGDTSFDGLVEEVELRRDANNTLGLSIVGGVDHCSHPFGADAPGIFISKIAENSPAAALQRLRVGDRILRVNGRDVEKAKHGEAVEALKKSGPSLRIGVRHEPQPRGLRELSFRRRSNDTKLGLSICGGINSPPVIAADPSDEGIFIERVEPRGCAALDCPQLCAGMRILEVNDDSLLGCTKSEAAELLRAATSPIRLLVCDGFSPIQEDGRGAMPPCNGQHQQQLSTALTTPASSPTSTVVAAAIDNFKSSETSAKQFSSTTNLPHQRLVSMNSLSQSESAPSHQITRFSTTLAQAPTKMAPPPIAPKPQPPKRMSPQVDSEEWNFENNISKCGSSTSFSAAAGALKSTSSANNSVSNKAVNLNNGNSSAVQQHSPSNYNNGKHSSPYASAPSTSSQNIAATTFGSEPNQHNSQHKTRANDHSEDASPPNRDEWFSRTPAEATDLGGGRTEPNDAWKTAAENVCYANIKPVNNNRVNNDNKTVGSLVERNDNNNNTSIIRFVDEPSEG